MRHVSHIVTAAALAVALAGCGDPYSSGYGNSQSYAYPSSYPANYSSYPAQSGYYPTRYGYGSTGNYYRNYSGTQSGRPITFTFP